MSFDKFHPEQSSSLPRQRGGLAGNRITLVIKRHYAMEFRDNLFQGLQTLRSEIGVPVINPRESSPRFGKALHEAQINRIGAGSENYGNFCRRPPRCYGDGACSCIYEVDFVLFQISCCLLRRLWVALRVSDRQDKLFSLFKSQLP